MKEVRLPSDGLGGHSEPGVVRETDVIVVVFEDGVALVPVSLWDEEPRVLVSLFWVLCRERGVCVNTNF